MTENDVVARRTLSYDEICQNAGPLLVGFCGQGQRHVIKRLYMPPTEGYECRATLVEEILTNPQLPKGIEENDVDRIAPVQKYPSYLAMGDLDCDDQGVVMRESDSHRIALGKCDRL